MTDKTKNLVMVDFSYLDPRSFKRHTDGTGDQRADFYHQVADEVGESNLRAVKEAYRSRVIDVLLDAEEAEMQRQLNTPSPWARGSAIASRMSTAAVGLALGVMVYQAFSPLF